MILNIFRSAALSFFALTLLLCVNAVATEPGNKSKTIDKRPASDNYDLSLTHNSSPDADLLNGHPLTLEQLLQRVVRNNHSVLLKANEWQIRQAEEEETQAIFEPQLTTSLSREGHSQRNSIEESLSRASQATYSEYNWTYDAAVETLVSSGAKVKLGYDLDRLDNSLTSTLSDIEHEYQMYLGVSVEQPLLRDAGRRTTHSAINAAAFESKATFHDYRQEMMDNAGTAVADYWNYYQAAHTLALRQKSQRIAAELLNDNRERYHNGKMAQGEVLEALVGLNNRRSLRSETEYELINSANRLRTLLGLNATDASPVAEAALAEMPHTRHHTIDSRDAVMFAYGESTITTAMKARLDNLAAMLDNPEQLHVEITGHTDSDGLSAPKKARYGNNIGLGLARARSVGAYLRAILQLDADQLKVSSMGAAQPLASNATIIGKAQNRRVEISITTRPEPFNPVPALTAQQQQGQLNIDLSEPEERTIQALDKQQLLRQAFELSPQYLAARERVEQADIRIEFASNQTRPELNLLASYGLNGLDETFGDSWQQLSDATYSTWSAGIEFKIPLQGNRKQNSKLLQAKLEKRHQLLRLKELETAICNRIDSALGKLATTTRQLHYARRNMTIHKQLFVIARDRHAAGQGNSREVLDKEDSYRQAREDALISLIDQQKALLEIELAGGRLLHTYNIDPLEVMP